MTQSATASSEVFAKNLKKIEIDRAREIAMILLQSKYGNGFDMRDYSVTS